MHLYNSKLICSSNRVPTGERQFLGRRSIEANPLTDLCGDYLSRIEEALKRELDHYSWSEFHAPLRYACDGGKRIRPLILVLSAEAINGRKANGDAYLAASAIELLHTESIIHDDIVDEENTRRGKPSFHIKYGYNSSILTADFVLGIILAIGSKLKNPHVINELSNAATRMSEGEMMEIRLTKAPAITEDDYIKVLDHKTASLFEASAKIGAILAEGSDEQVRAARIAAEGTRQEQQVGLRTTIDVLNAEQELRQAELNAVSSRRDEYVAAANVLAIMGRLEGRNLVPSVPQYDSSRN